MADMIPWQVYALSMFAIGILGFTISAIRFRKKWGKNPDIEEIRKAHPRAKVFRLWPSSKDKNSN